MFIKRYKPEQIVTLWFCEGKNIRIAAGRSLLEKLRAMVTHHAKTVARGSRLVLLVLITQEVSNPLDTCKGNDRFIIDQSLI